MRWEKKLIFGRIAVICFCIIFLQFFREAKHLATFNSPTAAAIPPQNSNDSVLLQGNGGINKDYGIGEFETSGEIGITSNEEEDENDDDDEIESDKNVLAIVPSDELTGSFVNCSFSQRDEVQLNKSAIEEYDDPDSGTTSVSCYTIEYRAPIQSFKSCTSPIIVGILSNAGDNGPVRRQTIRDTWAKDQSGVFFIVAGPWDGISNEYEQYGDLIWINEEEIYNRERSVLQMKTLSFLSILYTISKKLQNMNYSYAFKTDDDSYVDIDTLHTLLTANATHPPDYWGHCMFEMLEPHRDAQYKWSISIEDYPQPFWPLYCQGAGYAMSRTFIECAGDGDHIGQVRPIPFEDTAVGMLAERCHILPTRNDTVVRLHRWTSKKAKTRISLGQSPKDLWSAPPACMTGKVVQHRIFSELDMRNHYRTVLDPSYCSVTKTHYEAEMKRRKGKRKKGKRNGANANKLPKGIDDDDDDDSNNYNLAIAADITG